MARINLTNEILNHTDAEIIEYAAEVLRECRTIMNSAKKDKNSELMYAMTTPIAIVHSVLAELDRRNKERSLQ